MQVPSLSLSPVVLAIVSLAFLLLLLEIFTIGYAFIRQVQDHRQEEIDPSTRERIVETVSTEEPPYDELVSRLSRREHSAATRVTRELMEQTTGPVTDNLRSLAKELGMYQTAIEKVTDGDRIDRLHGLTTLSLLQHPPDTSAVRARCLDDPVLRGAGANALASAGTTDGYQAALDILYHESSAKLSGLGMETVNTVGHHKPRLLLDVLADVMPDATDIELVQTLMVIAELKLASDIGEALPTWITDAFSADNPQVRVAAVHSVEQLGPSVSDESTEAASNAIDDPDPRVRIAAAEIIESWEYNERLLFELVNRLMTEPNVRVRKRIVTTLQHHNYRPERSLPPAAKDAWDWGDAVTGFQSKEIA